MMFLSHGGPGFLLSSVRSPGGGCPWVVRQWTHGATLPIPGRRLTDWAIVAPCQLPCGAHNLIMLLFLGKLSPHSQEHFPRVRSELQMRGAGRGHAPSQPPRQCIPESQWEETLQAPAGLALPYPLPVSIMHTSLAGAAGTALA